MTLRPLPRVRPGSQRGAFAVLYAIMLPAMLGVVGMAIDLSMMYARGHELQSVADGAALAAARMLDGTEGGIARAKTAARDTAVQAKYRFLDTATFSWDNDALEFAATPNGPWIKAADATGSATQSLFYARVDTDKLDNEYAYVRLAFLHVVGVDRDQYMARRAVAGRKESALGPVAVCALNNTELTKRSNAPANLPEALEYGFRRGVTYNLLNLNPYGSTPIHYAVNPVDFPPALPRASHTQVDVLLPFACSGKIPAPPLATDSTLYVRAGFPTELIGALNSRFGDYGAASACTKFGSPPDVNIIDYRGYSGFWMRGLPEVPGSPGTPDLVRHSADSYTGGGKLLTIADAEGVQPGTNGASYGTLWSFSRPLSFVADAGGGPGGTMGAPINRSEWPRLYPVASTIQLSTNYNNNWASPYKRNASPHNQLPAPLSGEIARRVLNVPLLECPFSGSSARMLGIGRFLMTTRATTAPAGIHAEFGGLTTYGSLVAGAVLYQ